MASRRLFATILAAALLPSASLSAAPSGYVKTTIPLPAPPVGLAFDDEGNLFALENAGAGNNVATLQWIRPDQSMGPSFTVAGANGDDVTDLFFGSMIYDSLADRLLISDNTVDGLLYAIDKQGNQETIASHLKGVAGIAVRNTGEIFVSTSPPGRAGEVLQIDRTTGATTIILDDLGFGAGLAFEANGDLLVQDAFGTPLAGRIRRLSPTSSEGPLTFGSPQPVADGMTSSAGIALDSEGQLFSTGLGGLYAIQGEPGVESLFDANGRSGQFATAIAFAPGMNPFEPFAGPDAGRLAYMADFGFTPPDIDNFITLLTPARPEDANSDGAVNGADLAIWAAHLGATAANPAIGDANQNGTVDGADFLRWQQAASGQASANARAGVPAPEPDASIVFFLGLLPFAWQNRSRD